MTGLETVETVIPHISFSDADSSSQKTDSAFRTISEVSVELDIPQHVLRFWETKFTQIHPVKRNGGRRYYRPEDIELIRKIKHLLYQQGYTIRGVQRVLRRHHTDSSDIIVQDSATEQPADLAVAPVEMPIEAEVADVEVEIEVAELSAPEEEVSTEEALREAMQPLVSDSVPAVDKETSNLFAAAMVRLQPLAHVMAIQGVYPLVGNGAVPALPPKPAALRAAAEKAAAAFRARQSLPVTRIVPPVKAPKFDAAVRVQLEGIFSDLQQLRLDLDAIK